MSEPWFSALPIASMETYIMTTQLTKLDVEDALRRVLDVHNRSPWFDTETASSTLPVTQAT
jgi:hypothetical protein